MGFFMLLSPCYSSHIYTHAFPKTLLTLTSKDPLSNTFQQSLITSLWLQVCSHTVQPNSTRVEQTNLSIRVLTLSGQISDGNCWNCKTTVCLLLFFYLSRASTNCSLTGVSLRSRDQFARIPTVAVGGGGNRELVLWPPWLFVEVCEARVNAIFSVIIRKVHEQSGIGN